MQRKAAARKGKIRSFLGEPERPKCCTSRQNPPILAYATTIHKSQGSEYPAVVIPVTTQHYLMLQRNLLYTGVTRGKRLVILLGQKKAVAIAVKNVSGRRRWSKLREWLCPASEGGARGLHG
jgi:ATP-dependent exoDNAse (exonuclease V) alpha subunit